jgi:hypothetical protein
MRHKLFDSVDELLVPGVLSQLTGQQVSSIRTRPLHADFGKSGSRLHFVETNDGRGPRFVLKRVSPAWDWQMRATEDHLCRSVTLWQRGIFDRMPPEIEHGVVAGARDGAGWAILMKDVSQVLATNRRFSVTENQIFLDAMAAMHTTFFEDPELTSPALGLCTLAHVYGVFSPQTGHREADESDEIPKRILEGWERVWTLVTPDVARVVEPLLDDPTPLCAALGRYPATLVHGDWRHANQGIVRDEVDAPRVVMLDWQLAAVGPPSVELGRYLGANSALLPGAKEETLACYRQSLARRLGDRFSDDWWQPQLDLGLLGGFVQDGWAIALKATTWRIGADARDHWSADLTWWSERVRAGARWLSTTQS